MKFFSIVLLIFLQFNLLSADTSHYIDFNKILNTSVAGKKAQEILKSKFKNENEKYIKIEKSIKNEELALISKKKILKEVDYKKGIQDLRNKVLKLQKDRQTSLNQIAKSRIDAKNQLLSKLIPIIEKHMQKKKIKIVLEKKSVLVGEATLDLTNSIIEIFNNEVKSIKVK